MEKSATVAMITGIIALITSLVTSYRSFYQSKKIETLKNDLEIKKENDTQILKFLLSYETDKINQNLLAIKDYLTTIQKIKDQLRYIVNNLDSFFKQDIVNNVVGLRNEVTDKYSSYVYFFNQSDTNKNAHTIKNLFLKIFDLMMLSNIDIESINATISEITERQSDLQSDMNNEIEKLIHSIKK